ncbi:MAG: GNAT family N-acetyltransferase [Verrucomicrobiota bacterium]
MKIEEIDIDDGRLAMDLLQLADPSEDSIREYLPKSRIYLESIEQDTIAIAAVREKENEAELMNLAVQKNFQKKGIGSQMLKYIKESVLAEGIDLLTVGTGNSSLKQLSFYQRNGFRISDIRKNHFKDYHPHIYENGIRCIDMIVLSAHLQTQPVATGQRR